MHISTVQQLGRVPFPAFTGERVYMREFTKRGGLPEDLSRWQPTVNAMLDGVDATGSIFMMIDQGVVQPGASHRRPGLHVDGYWLPAMHSHGGGGRHSASAAGWDNGSRWKQCDFSVPEPLVLASDVAASRAFIGEWDGSPGEGGDCSHIDTSGMQEIRLQAGVAYAGNVAMLHESLPVDRLTRRTLVRLSVKA